MGDSVLWGAGRSSMGDQRFFAKGAKGLEEVVAEETKVRNQMVESEDAMRGTAKISVGRDDGAEFGVRLPIGGRGWAIRVRVEDGGTVRTITWVGARECVQALWEKLQDRLRASEGRNAPPREIEPNENPQKPQQKPTFQFSPYPHPPEKRRREGTIFMPTDSVRQF